MIIWSTSTKVGGQEVVDKKCSHCGANSMILVMYHGVFSLFFFPMFPYDKSYGLTCGECNTQYEVDESCAEVQKNEIKCSKWNFLGLFLIIALLVGGAFAPGPDPAKVTEQKKQLMEYKKHPQIEDTIVFYDKTVRHPYAYFKIIGITKDKFYIKASKYTYKRSYKAESAATRGSQKDFREEVYAMPKEKIGSFEISKWIRKKHSKK